ncbi:hypothetical protein WJX84_009405 [Apatococcus fuscideae]|uniref:Ubiquitin-like domain-containing protein n=1 Tax=Apatococcus fuscideae TaxID=2026836 RepID=A0AAW1TFL5_9CHLO
MQCYAQCDWSRHTRSLQVQPSTTVREVKNAVAQSLQEAQTWLEYQGRQLRDSTQLQDAGVADGSRIHIHLRLQGGGGDGGSTGAESRSCFLEMYSMRKAAKVNPIEEKLARWTQCQLSGEPLQQPVVTDQLGYLFNKDAIIQALLKKSMPKALGHITSLKQLIELKLTPAPAGGAKAATATTFQPGNDAPFVCPITELPLNGRFRAVVLRPSGLVVSERALKEMPELVRERAGGQSLEASAMLPLNGTTEEGIAAWKLEPSTGLGHAAKKYRAAQHIPDGATKSVYSSIFIGDRQPVKETYSCRATSARGMNIA